MGSCRAQDIGDHKLPTNTRRVTYSCTNTSIGWLLEPSWELGCSEKIPKDSESG